MRLRQDPNSLMNYKEIYNGNIIEWRYSGWQKKKRAGEFRISNLGREDEFLADPNIMEPGVDSGL